MSTQENKAVTGARVTKKNKSFVLILVAGIVLLVFTILILSLSKEEFSLIGNKEYDLRNTGITSIENIKIHGSPTLIDIRENDIPVDDVLELIGEYPDCQILWTVPLGGQKIDNNVNSIEVKDIKAEEVYLLQYFNQLENVDAKGVDYDVLTTLLNENLSCTIDWDVTIGDNVYSADTTRAVVGNVSDEEVRKLLMLTELKYVDASECTAYDALFDVREQLPECEFVWKVDIGGFSVDCADEVLDFQRNKVDDIEGLSADFEKLKYLPALKTIDMCGCGVDNEQMAQWRDKYPEKKFVWEITFGNGKKHWTVRTDIIAFSSLNSYGEGTAGLGDENFYRDLFLYCTDLILLDLGHNKIKDISMIANLKKLEAVIFSDNPISDFSPLAELPELRFAEIINTRISDLSFVPDCEKLEHLDVSYSEVSDLTTLDDSKSLKYLILYQSRVSKKKLTAFEETHPGCYVSLHGAYQYQILRNSPLRSEYRLAVLNYDKLETYVSWEEFTFKKDVKVKYPAGYRSKEYYASGEYHSEFERFKGYNNY